MALLKAMWPSAVDLEMPRLSFPRHLTQISFPSLFSTALSHLLTDSQAMALLKAMSPSAVDLELRAIEIVDDSPSPADLNRVALFMSFLEGKLRGSCDFELLQAVTHRFLAVRAWLPGNEN
ncbi:unnamed protein product [Closterium sp. NIES-54]